MWIVTGLLVSSLVVSIFSTIALKSIVGIQLFPAIQMDPTIRFYLWTRKNPLKSAELFTNRADVLLASPLDFDLPVKILIHGFLSDSKSTFARKVRETYVAVQGVNVVAVDWSGIAAIPDYELAFRNTRKVGKQVAEFVDFLVSSGIVLSRIHVVGFSLGAHVSGWVGQYIQSGRLVRITALDPAKLPAKVRADGFVYRSLGPSDAEFVDAIHTHGHPRLGFGTLQPVGHADFYPNGGSIQPPCKFRTGERDFSDKVTCHHSMAYLLFAESIWRFDGGAFRSVQCPSFTLFVIGLCGSCSRGSANCNSLGEHANPRVQGTLFLLTNLRRPFSIDQF